MNYIEDKIKAIEKNIEYKRDNDQRKLINIIQKTNNDKTISFNPIICIRVYIFFIVSAWINLINLDFYHIMLIEIQNLFIYFNKVAKYLINLL